MSISSIRKDFGSSSDLEQQGVWVKVPLSDPSAKVECLLARMGGRNKAWLTRASLIHHENKEQLELGIIPDEVLDDAIKLFCETVLLSWRGMTNDDGVEVPYTATAGFKLLKEIPDLYEYLAGKARKLSTYQQRQEAKILGKSKNTSSGS